MNIFDLLNVEKETAEKAVEMQNSISIEVDRDSVCMGDDCFSHRTNLTLPESTNLFQLLKRLADYVPTMKNIVWSVRSNVGMCGYIVTDADGNASFGLCGANMLVTEMKITQVLCTHFYPNNHSELVTLLEKIKKYNDSTDL